MSRATRGLRRALARVAYGALGPRTMHRLTHLRRTRPTLTRSGDVVTDFHRLSYESGALNETYWMGRPILKSPMDLWTYQEIIFELRPDLIVETGTYLGGSALFFANMCDLVGHGQVVTVDLVRRVAVDHPRVTQLEGDALSEHLLSQLAQRTQSAHRVMVVLDDDHSAEHVLREMRVYARFVTRGSFLVVEDTNVNGHPVAPEHGPGPGEAVAQFLADTDQFVVDRAREKFLLTYFPGGWLRRI